MSIKKMTGAVVLGIILALIALFVNVTETLIEAGPIVTSAVIGLLAGVFLTVAIQFHKKIKKGELRWADFNPWYLVMDISPIALIWTTIYNEALTVKPPDAPLLLACAYVMGIFAFKGYLFSAGIDIVWQWLLKAFPKRT